MPVSTDTNEVIEAEHRYGARNYDPLPVVLSHGEGVWVRDVDATIAALKERAQSGEVRIGGVVSALRLRNTKKGDRYGSFNPDTGTYLGYDGLNHFCVAN